MLRCCHLVGSNKTKGQGPIQGAPRCSKRLKTGKNDQNLSIFINFLPSLTMKGLVICLASLISAAELDKKAEDP